MLSYPFINDLFKAVLAASAAIQGRFHICPKGGTEINSDELGEVIQDLVQSRTEGAPRYPMALLMPPRATGSYSRADGWDEYSITLFFLKQSYVNSENQTQDPNPNTGTSMHTVPQDWHDMKRCAVGFMRALDLLQRRNTGAWRITPRSRTTTPVTKVGIDGASGVRLDFYLQLFIGCDLEDYTQEDLTGLILPTTDSHPQHQL